MIANARNRALRTLIATLDVSVAVCLALIVGSGFAAPAYAYVDPSVMTYTIQALAGVAVALSAVIGVAWRRLRRVLLKLLKIDENAGKEVDAKVHRLDPGDAAYAARIKEANERARRMKASLDTEKPEKLCWSSRLLFALAASVMLVFTVVVAGPLEIVAASPESLMFGVSDVWALLAVCAVAATLVAAFALSALRGRAFNVAFAVVAALGIAAYIQVLFLNTSLPPADGNQVDWARYMPITVLSSVVWIALIAGAVLFALKKSLVFKGVASALCLVGIVAQSVSLGLVLATPAQDGYTPLQGKPTVTMDGISEVSNKDNVIVFVLDTFDTAFLRQAVETDPACLDGFTGFTWFENSTGSMIPTRYAMSTLLTGRTLTSDDASYSTPKIAEWYTEHNLLDDIREQGYEVDVYATDIYDAIGALSEKANNIKPLDFEVDALPAVASLVKCSLYRDSPWLLKPAFWFYTDEVNNAVLVEDSDDPGQLLWKMDDAGYDDLIESKGLSAVDMQGKGSFRVIHLAGTHAPYTIDRNGDTVEGGTDMIEQGLGALQIVNAYLDELKRLGLYESSTIIVTADHGEWYLADDIAGPTNPMLLAKPAGAADEPLAISSVPTGHLDFAATLLHAVGGDESAYGGMNMFDVADEPRTRYFCSTSVVGPDHEYTRIKQWKIEGDACQWENWSESGTEWPIE
ncbi:MAG: sulfatase-like hydrolase/transferase [Slackia sp.]|nr:sulfatase-like hydrolase/transferase [Slackia sp.]